MSLTRRVNPVTVDNFAADASDRRVMNSVYESDDFIASSIASLPVHTRERLLRDKHVREEVHANRNGELIRRYRPVGEKSTVVAELEECERAGRSRRH